MSRPFCWELSRRGRTELSSTIKSLTYFQPHGFLQRRNSVLFGGRHHCQRPGRARPGWRRILLLLHDRLSRWPSVSFIIPPTLSYITDGHPGRSEAFCFRRVAPDAHVNSIQRFHSISLRLLTVSSLLTIRPHTDASCGMDVCKY
ncbi:hypothetical protein BV25DRAFT_1308963 [Artomyces pyxidatus]|uniref:Uncharacterized protein n=1 Tax=Artomyces pyxidatus TaxID=48021 RepID=A0ACB8SQ62_9AGAM|nr:hypothetical protein BV25DRAFT_1308963 [Artomyces pyxidatus]